MALALLTSTQSRYSKVEEKVLEIHISEYLIICFIPFYHIQVGACVVLEEPRRILSVGYNGPPEDERTSKSVLLYMGCFG